MKVSLNWVRWINSKYGCAADPMPKGGINELVEKIGAQLGAVEEVIALGKKYEGIVVAKVVSCDKHPNADKLKLCLIDDGGVNKKVKRTKDGLVGVVCGAPNVKAGQLVAWIPPGVIVPATAHKDPFMLEVKEIRGQLSNGMIASAKELSLSDEHEGILVIDQPTKPGQPLTEVYDLNDYVIDIENKMFTHRPDLFGQLGIARELAGIQGHVFKSPDWYRQDARVPKGNARDTHKLVVKNEVPKLVPRFCMAVVKDVAVGPSPAWLQIRLASVGIRSINNIVDLTNFYMMETAQPLHAYDYDKLKALDRASHATIVVRRPKLGEELKAIGEKIIKFQPDDIVIASASKAIGLGGVMGGAETEVDETTKNIVIEVGNFNMYAIRRSAMAHGLFTDAATRFTKGHSPLQNMAILAYMVADIKRLAGGRVTGEVHDINHVSAAILKQGNIHPPVTLSAEFINALLGLNLSPKQIANLLTNVEFKVNVAGSKLTVAAPFWRTDIAIPEDVVEEVGRLYGYDHLPLELPQRNLAAAAKNPMLSLQSQVRDILTRAGGNEVLSYSFVHGDLLRKAGQNPQDAFHIKNALSPDLQYCRLSLAPSLLEKVHPNVKAGFPGFALYELGITHVKSVLDAEKLPAELERLALVVAYRNMDKAAGAPYYQTKHVLEYLLHELGIGAEFKQLAGAKLNKAWQLAVAAFELTHSAAVYSGRQLIGLVGEPSARLRTGLKLPTFSAMFELDLKLLLALASDKKPYRSLNKFPPLQQDITFKVTTEVSFSQLTDFIYKMLEVASKDKGYIGSLLPIDIFQKPTDKAHKHITLRLNIRHPERTLTTEEINQLLDKIAKAAKKQLEAERI